MFIIHQDYALGMSIDLIKETCVIFKKKKDKKQKRLQTQTAQFNQDSQIHLPKINPFVHCFDQSAEVVLLVVVVGDHNRG